MASGFLARCGRAGLLPRRADFALRLMDLRAMRPDFPLPDTTWEPTREFWAGADRHEVRIPRCEQCGRCCWYPRDECRFCGGTSFRWDTMSGRATLFSWVVVTHAFGGYAPPRAGQGAPDERPDLGLVIDDEDAPQV